jgi:hypothetical protein
LTFDVVKSVSIENLLAQRNAMIDRVRKLAEGFAELDSIGLACGIVRPDKFRHLKRLLCGSDHYARVPLLDSDREIPEIIKRMDASGWAYLMEESGLLTFMDSKARAEWAKKIETLDVPPLTRENIEATFTALRDARGDIFERGVIECFRALAWCYKTNLPHKFGKRIHARVRHYGSVDHEAMNSLEDLNRVFSVMDGKPEDDARNALYSRLHNAERVDGEPYRRHDRFVHDDTYMSFRVFKNGKAQVTFKRPDLVRNLNQILARHHPNALPERVA